MGVLEPGAIVGERFRLVKPLGQGGMGAVWQAHHEALDIPCAVKFIRHDKVNERLRSRFRQEARAAAKLRSPNVVQILDYGLWEGTPYIAMELLEGESLADRLGQGRLSTSATLGIIRDVARALSRASELGIVHRDLKPDNLFIVQDAEREITKVLDFGVAKASDAALTAEHRTRTGALVGTPYFVSPEQAHGERDLDSRSDLWSLAVITFCCLTGRLPFEATGLGALLQQIMHDPLPLPSAIAPDLPPAFDDWWQTAAEREPAERFQTPERFIAALEEALLGADTRARATTTPSGGRAIEETPPSFTLAHTVEQHPGTHAPLEADARTHESATPETPVRRPSLALPIAAAGLIVGGIGLYAARALDAPDRPEAAGEPSLAEPSRAEPSRAEPSTAAASPSAEAPVAPSVEVTASATSPAQPELAPTAPRPQPRPLIRPPPIPVPLPPTPKPDLVPGY